MAGSTCTADTSSHTATKMAAWSRTGLVPRGLTRLPWISGAFCRKSAGSPVCPRSPGSGAWRVFLSRVRSLQLIFVLFHGHAHELAARAHAGFVKQALENGLDVAFRDLHPPGNFFVGKAFQDEAQHLALPIVEGRRGGLRRGRRIFAESGDRKSTR